MQKNKHYTLNGRKKTFLNIIYFIYVHFHDSTIPFCGKVYFAWQLVGSITIAVFNSPVYSVLALYSYELDFIWQYPTKGSQALLLMWWFNQLNLVHISKPLAPIVFFGSLSWWYKLLWWWRLRSKWLRSKWPSWSTTTRWLTKQRWSTTITWPTTPRREGQELTWRAKKGRGDILALAFKALVSTLLSMMTLPWPM